MWGDQVHVVMYCMILLACLLTHYVQAEMGSGSVSRNTEVTSGSPGHLDRASAHPVEVEGDINNGSHQLLQPWRIHVVLESSHGSLVFSIQSLIYCTKSGLM